MTVWVYRDGVLASDSQISVNTTRTGSIKKIHRSPDGWLAAGAGSMSQVVTFFKWVDEGRQEDYPNLDNFEGLLVSPEGDVFHVEGDLVPFSFEAEWHVGGSGAEIAFGACVMGASAVRAVEIAIDYNTGCGGEVQVLTLKGK